MATDILTKDFDAFASKHYNKIMQSRGISEDDMKAVLKVILRLNPAPGGSVADSYADVTEQIVPDFVLKDDDGEVSFIMPRFNIPEIRINKKYAAMLENARGGSVREEISFGPRQLGLSAMEVNQRTDDVMAMLDLQDLAERAPYHLSGGEQKKTALASILAMNPIVLILDEPLNGLDRRTRQWMLSFLKQWKQAGRTLLLSSHDETLLRSIPDRILELNEKHTIIFDGLKENWNDAKVYSYEIGKRFTTKVLLDKWKEVIETVGRD